MREMSGIQDTKLSLVVFGVALLASKRQLETPRVTLFERARDTALDRAASDCAASLVKNDEAEL